jgi:hypothetical protein
MVPNRKSRLAAAECAMVRGARLPNCYQSPCHAACILLYSAGILAHDFPVVIIGTPQGTSKDHKGPGELNLPGAFFICL